MRKSLLNNRNIKDMLCKNVRKFREPHLPRTRPQKLGTLRGLSKWEKVDSELESIVSYINRINNIKKCREIIG